MDSYAVEVEDLFVRFNSNNTPILCNLEIKIKKGQIIGIVGESGIGKSTFLKTLNGIIPKRQSCALEGKIHINGKNIDEISFTELSSLVGTVFQNPDDQIVFPLVEDELAFGPENLCISKDEIEKRISYVIEQLSIEDLINRNPNSLSGGEKQLVTLASILCLGADIILLDEALSYLDQKGKERVKRALTELRRLNKTIIMVEHDLDNLDIADSIYELDDGRFREVS